MHSRLYNVINSSCFPDFRAGCPVPTYRCGSVPIGAGIVHKETGKYVFIDYDCFEFAEQRFYSESNKLKMQKRRTVSVSYINSKGKKIVFITIYLKNGTNRDFAEYRKFGKTLCRGAKYSNVWLIFQPNAQLFSLISNLIFLQPLSSES